ncbi:hypothetical protein EZH22_02080 [Xanthobacter dioxanivorans]|uniref:Uncharacterized protein n=1 Tax=Xanthobacter dioxanivorans TaxID=2528964 RepID=A0A974PPU2_9HYPH|nr:hypothetical protein [Xanthobacter dioxanivorans]QRG07251.1 hypothetical protein EZH22_02080 [Xanthobacter dioxanivorans]
MVRIFIPNIPEFTPVWESARAVTGCVVKEPLNGYWRIEAPDKITFGRKALGLGPALWNSALTGGFVGRIVEYSRDTMCIESKD